MNKFTIALLYNSKQNAPHAEGEQWDAWNELDSEKTAGQIERALRAGGHEVIAMEGDVTLPQKLAHYKVDIAFNICEGHYGGSREAQVPAILDMLRIPYTGAGVMTLALALDKPMTKRVMACHGLPTPAFQTFVSGDEALEGKLKFPLFAKPSREGSGIGISAKAVCHNNRELREQVRFLIDAYHQPVLVEEYIDGREFTLGLLGNLEWNIKSKRVEGVAANLEMALAGLEPGPVAKKTKVSGNGRAKKQGSPAACTLRVFPPLEVDLSPCPEDQAGLYTSVIKSQMYNVPKYLCPAPTTKALRTKMERLAVSAFTALECTDFARVDFRVRADTGQPTILEINPLAGLQEGISDMVMGAEAIGINYTALVNGILEAALQRHGMI
jgi:D-alanine-D-alanine ligase